MHEVIKFMEGFKNSLLTVFSVDFLKLTGKVLLVISLVLFFSYLVKLTLRKLYKKLRKTKRFWDDILVEALISPLISLILVIGITFIVDVVNVFGQKQEQEIIPVIRSIVLIIAIAWFALSYIGFSEKRYISQKKKSSKGRLDLSSVDLISKVAKIAIVIIAALIIMDLIGVKLTAILTFAGVGGVAIGFASKDLLANFFGTILIYTDKLFVIGDWIRFPDKVEGIVEEISWRITRIRTFEKKQLYVPNSVFSSTSIENCSNMTHRRIKEIIGIRYKDINRLDRISKDIKSMLKKHRHIDNKEIIYVNFSSFGDSSVNFTIYAFTTAKDIVKYNEVRHDICLKVAGIIHDHNADIAFPTRVLATEENMKIGIYNEQKKGKL